MTTKKTTKVVSLSEFQAWLEGIEELQDRGWTPDAKQWKLIRAKIKRIVPDTQQIVTHTRHDHHPNQQRQAGYQQPQSGSPFTPAPDAPSSIPSGPVQRGATTPQQVGMPMTTNAKGDKVMKTPDIEGDYNESTFS